MHDSDIREAGEFGVKRCHVNVSPQSDVVRLHSGIVAFELVNAFNI